MYAVLSHLDVNTGPIERCVLIGKEVPMPKLADLPRVRRIQDDRSREQVREVLKASQEAVRDAVRNREANQEKELHSFSFRF